MKNRRFTGIVSCIIAAAILLCAAGTAAGEGLTRPGEEGWMSDFAPSSGDAEILDYIETQELYASLADKTLLAASGAGAWEGRLNVDADGSFTGHYYDEDAGDEVIYEVSFSGRFAANAEVHGYQYWLWVAELNTQQTPGTSVPGEYGERIEYTEAPFQKNTFMVLTLIQTPAEQIPETVKEEIGGTYGEWNDYSRFVTLTRPDGWGFFADGYESNREEPEEPAETPKEAVPADAAEPAADSGVQPGELAGCWMTGDDDGGEMIITSGGDGTLHMKVMFLRTFDIEADLKPTDGSRYAFETAYGHYSGFLTRGNDGTLRFEITGGMSMEDDENELYYFFADQEYVFRPADYSDLWYEVPSDGPEDDGDWVGEWTARYGGLTSELKIVRGTGGSYIMQVHFSSDYTVTGEMEKTDSRTMDFVTDDFSAMLTLNRKKHAILMSEIGSASRNVYLWLDEVGAVVEYQAEETAASVPEAQPEPASEPEQTGEQVPQYDPAEAALVPIPGRTGRMQVPAAQADATSYIVGKDPTAYIPYRMIDGIETTAYQFSVKDNPPGNAYLYFTFDVPSAMDELWIKNGFWKKTDGKDQYDRNCRVKSMTVEFCYAGETGYRDPIQIYLPDDRERKDWFTAVLGSRTNVTGVRIRIDDYYQGSKFKYDVCISEIMFVKRTDSE